MTARRYVTKRIVDRVAAQLSDRHRAILETAAKLSIVSEGQLRTLMGVESASDRRLFRMDMAGLVERRVLARLDRRIGGVRSGSDGFVYTLDVIGQRLTRPTGPVPRTPWTPQPNHLRHALAVSQIYIDLACATSPTMRLRAFEAEPTCWRSFAGPGGSRLLLKPDAFVIITGGDYQDRFFIEIDCATESTPRIIDKAKTYIRYYQSGREQERHGVFPLVVWIAPYAPARSTTHQCARRT